MHWLQHFYKPKLERGNIDASFYLLQMVKKYTSLMYFHPKAFLNIQIISQLHLKIKLFSFCLCTPGLYCITQHILIGLNATDVAKCYSLLKMVINIISYLRDYGSNLVIKHIIIIVF